MSPTPGRVLFGPAVTISFFPTCRAALDGERHNFANLFYEAVGEEPFGKVLTVSPECSPTAVSGISMS